MRVQGLRFIYGLVTLNPKQRDLFTRHIFCKPCGIMLLNNQALLESLYNPYDTTWGILQRRILVLERCIVGTVRYARSFTLSALRTMTTHGILNNSFQHGLPPHRRQLVRTQLTRIPVPPLEHKHGGVGIILLAKDCQPG